jgi:hypothetical protein
MGISEKGMTDLEREVLNLAIQWADAKYAVEEALIRQQFLRTIRMLKKERRDEKPNKSGDRPPAG